MNDNEKNFIKNVNIDKAKNKTKKCILLSIISLLSYALPLITGEFDFGMVFEIITLVFIFIARSYMTSYDIDRSKRYIILAMIPIGWLLIYDTIAIMYYISDILDFVILGIDFALKEALTILNLIVLFVINNILKKADNPEKYKESMDWFYERLDEKEIKEHSNE